MAIFSSSLREMSAVIVSVSVHLKAEKAWSGRRESNPRMQLGKLPFYH
jgi:hypothetical protein